jgi:hypothetical protein
MNRLPFEDLSAITEAMTKPQLLEWVQATLPRIRHDYANVLTPKEETHDD